MPLTAKARIILALPYVDEKSNIRLNAAVSALDILGYSASHQSVYLCTDVVFSLSTQGICSGKILNSDRYFGSHHVQEPGHSKGLQQMLQSVFSAYNHFQDIFYKCQNIIH